MSNVHVADDESPTLTFRRPGAAPPPPPPADMLTVKEAADLLRVNVKTIHKLLATGDLPHHRFGRVIRIPLRVPTSTRKSV
jgi:excisionase family DNA binding protein